MSFTQIINNNRKHHTKMIVDGSTKVHKYSQMIGKESFYFEKEKNEKAAVKAKSSSHFRRTHEHIQQIAFHFNFVFEHLAG